MIKCSAPVAALPQSAGADSPRRKPRYPVSLDGVDFAFGRILTLGPVFDVGDASFTHGHLDVVVLPGKLSKTQIVGIVAPCSRRYNVRTTQHKACKK